MSFKTSAVLITATTLSLIVGVQSAEAHHLRFLRFPHIFTPAPEYGYDNYDEFYEDDFAYADPRVIDDYADPYYVPRRHKKKQRVVQDDAGQWWLQERKPQRLKNARALEPIYQKPRAKKTVSASTAAKKKSASAAKPMKQVKPKITTASLAPAKPKAAKTIGCTAGAAIVTGYGFANVTPKTCTGNVYAYSAQRDGKPYLIKVTAAQGEITEVTKQ